MKKVKARLRVRKDNNDNADNVNDPFFITLFIYLYIYSKRLHPINLFITNIVSSSLLLFLQLNFIFLFPLKRLRFVISINRIIYYIDKFGLFWLLISIL